MDHQQKRVQFIGIRITIQMRSNKMQFKQYIVKNTT